MGSLFDSEVYAARRRVPWADINAEALLAELTQHTDGNIVTLTVEPRPSVSSRLWWSLAWKDDHRQSRAVSAQTLSLCLWRAALIELACRRRADAASRRPDGDAPDEPFDDVAVLFSRQDFDALYRSAGVPQDVTPEMAVEIVKRWIAQKCNSAAGAAGAEPAVR